MEAVQNIQSITQALQKAKELYNIKCLEQEKLRKDGAAQKEIEKVTLMSPVFVSMWKQVYCVAYFQGKAINWSLCSQ